MNIEVLLFANLKDVNDESVNNYEVNKNCLLYTSDAADE